MDNLLLFQVFECAVVIFETFIVHQYISGLFEKRYGQKSTLLWYLLFCLGLMLLSLFYYKEIALIIYTLGGVYTLAWKLYKTSISSRVFSIFYFSAIMVGSEIFCSSLMSGLWDIDLSNVLEYGAPRVLGILVAKLIQIFLVKISVFVASCKTDHPAKGEPKLMLPLLLCQILSITLAHYAYVICSLVFNGFSAIALFAMIGIIYINIIIFWYFDRVKATFEYKSKSEAAETKIELQKQYHDVLNEHQKETDALWHDMKKHINLMKMLINDGQHEITSDYIHELESQMSDKIKIVRTEYPVLSALLTEQKQRAKKAGILFDIDVRLESELKIEPVDLCVVLGNLFDNAFEACMLLPLEPDRQIKASIGQRNNAVAIKVENAYIATMKPKRSTGKHGLGLKNVRQTVRKYNGQIDIIENNGVFMVSIVIP